MTAKAHPCGGLSKVFGILTLSYHIASSPFDLNVIGFHRCSCECFVHVRRVRLSDYQQFLGFQITSRHICAIDEERVTMPVTQLIVLE